MRAATKRYLKAGLGWCSLYLALAILPMFTVMLDPPAQQRAFWIEFGVGLGFIGFALLLLQFALTARVRGVGRPFGIDTLLQFHRGAGLMAFAFILTHAIVLVIAHPPFLDFLDPRAGVLRAVFLVGVLILLIVILTSTLFRMSFGLSYEWWRLMHGILATLIVFVGLAHAIRVEHYFEPFWKQAFWVLLTGSAIALLLYGRIVRPLLMRRRPWRVTAIRRETHSTCTIAVEPIGHDGFHFQPGQYAWVTIHHSPFTLQQHPFSFSSSATSGKMEFTIKALGDFTRSIQNMKPGGMAYIEGPYGAFVLEDSAPGAVFLAGGIGLTPIMSILRTARDRNDKRPFTLLYGHADMPRGLFTDELQAMSKSMNLKLVHVLEEPHEGWTGETGFLRREVLDRHVDEHMLRAFPVFVCGPPAMMDALEQMLSTMGVPHAHIRSERFDIV